MIYQLHTGVSARPLSYAVGISPLLLGRFFYTAFQGVSCYAFLPVVGNRGEPERLPVSGRRRLLVCQTAAVGKVPRRHVEDCGTALHVV